MVNVGKYTIHGSFGIQVKLETNSPGVLDVHTLPFRVTNPSLETPTMSPCSPQEARLVEELKALSTHADQELSDGQDTKDPILSWIPLIFFKAWEKSDVYKVKYTSRERGNISHPKWQSRKIIDSKVIDLMGYVSSQEGKVNKIYIRIIT